MAKTDDGMDIPSFGNFGLEGMGTGNQELLEGLYAPETSTASPEDIKDIKEEDEKKPVPAAKKQVSKAAPIKKVEEEEEEESPKDPTGDQLVDQLLGEEEDEPVKTKQKVNETEEEEVEVNSFTALAKDLYKLGVFSQDEEGEEEEISSPEQFLEKFNLEKKKGAIESLDNFLGQFGDDYRNAFDAIFVKGVDPKEYFGTYNNIENYTSLDLTKEENQESVIRKGLLDQGFEPEDISAKLEKIRNYGDLEDESQRFHKVLIKKEASKLAQLEQDNEKKLQQEVQYKQQYATNVQTVLQEKLKVKEFDGIPINPKLAAELQDFLITDKYKTPSGEKLTEFDRTILDLKKPENHAMKVKVALLLKTLEKDPSLTTIQRKGLTKQSNGLFEEVARQTGKSLKSGGKSGVSSGSSVFSQGL